MQIRKSHPAVGWIRASQALTPEVRAELVELRAKVRELSADLKDEQRHHSEQVDPAELQQGDAEVEIECIVDYHWQETIDADEARRSNRERGRLTLTPTWNDLFKHLGPHLMDEASEVYLLKRLSAMCLDLAREELLEEDEAFAAKAVKNAKKEKTRQASRVGDVYDAEVALDSFNDVKVQFAALGLIEKGSRRRPPSDYKNYWLLTTWGNDLLMRIRAIRKPTATDSARGQTEG